MEIVNKGRKMVIAMITIVLTMDILTILRVSSTYAISGNLELASSKLIQGAFRLLLTGLMLFFLYKGHRWAKWLTVVLFSIAGISSVLLLISGFNLILFAMGVIYVLLGVIIISSGSVNNFFRYQRGELTLSEGEDVNIN